MRREPARSQAAGPSWALRGEGRFHFGEADLAHLPRERERLRHWIGVNNLNILATGLIVTAWSNQIALIDPDTGRIVRTGSLPSGEAPPEDSHFKHLTVASDGTLILKNQTRPAGSTEQGTMALIKVVRKGKTLPPSTLVAVDGQTLEVLDTAQLPELAATPHGITVYDGRIAVYTCASEAAYRHFWDPDSKKLSPTNRGSFRAT